MISMKIAQDAFNSFEYDSGMWLKTFDVNNPTTPADSAILCETTGDISITCEYEVLDLGEDVNNVHGEFMELQVHKGYKIGAQFTALTANADTIRMGFGAADIVDNKIVPRNYFKNSDFRTLYWVGKTLDSGLVVAELGNAISSGGLSFKTSKDGKGNLDVNLKAYASLEHQDVVPVTFYRLEPGTPSVQLSTNSVTMHTGDSPFRLDVTTVPADATVTWLNGDSDVCTLTETWYGVSITPVGTGLSAVTAKITVQGVEYSSTCIVKVTSSGA